jgi:hypothetical protein
MPDPLIIAESQVFRKGHRFSFGGPIHNSDVLYGLQPKFYTRPVEGLSSRRAGTGREIERSYSGFKVKFVQDGET